MMVKRAGNKLFKALPIAAAVFSACASGAKVDVYPSVGFRATHTDNVELANSSKESATIGSLYAALRATVDGNEGALSLNYRGTRAMYSHDSDRNSYYNSLQFSANKRFGQSGFAMNAEAKVDNVARSRRRDANDDILTGDTVTNRNASTNLSYSNGGRGYLSFGANAGASIRDASDDQGNSYGYRAGVSLGQGSRVTNYIWSTNYNFQKDDARGGSRNNQSHRVNGNLAIAQMYGFAPTVNYNWEKYEEKGFDDGEDRDRTFGRVGPGLRYYIDRKSFVELNYNFVVEGEGNDSWGGKVDLNPSRNTKIKGSYSKRVFGNSYDVLIQHKSKRMTNTVRYSEELTSFERDFFVEDEIIEDYSLRKVLDWTSSLKMKRSSVSLSLTSTRRERNDSDGQTLNDDTYGATLSYTRSLTRTTQFSSSFRYNKYQFDDSDQQKQNDYYRRFELSLSHSFLQSLSLRYGYQFSDRSSNEDDFGYEENRAYINLNKSF
ncbi:TIGR03016 family PEP-CTERM system-associated outer membrane protein [Neiella sp. HB171785]|uniref:TIGR03016 family PEP-CTERM system-associated outer membrane protein n=1 Tax=Neiella litorisoli TaxID=2771431 RepID=A0A8J6UQ83_9GAMM|nr:TIGR03016 family PEP-CTERM system-associated outer membrane protein [Neiella litorisoli]MBD1390527.1 TIGR03016 family PEP-CTERM system-associated outer membrane protein [Neiella litorisoli]